MSKVIEYIRSHETVLVYPKYTNEQLDYKNNMDTPILVPNSYMVVGIKPEIVERSLYSLLQDYWEIKYRDEQGVLLLTREIYLADKSEEISKKRVCRGIK
jgi:hypothetical protein